MHSSNPQCGTVPRTRDHATATERVLSGQGNADTRVTGEDTARRSSLVTFYRIIPSARLPQRADRSAVGSLPTRAFRYCEPATSASAFGYYIFPPIGFKLQWDGNDVMWTWDGADGWLPLKSVQFPSFQDFFDSVAPQEIREHSQPFLEALQEPGLVQLWTGIVVRTAPDWSLMVRSPINVPRSGAYELFEGIIETDRWFGPLITTMRLTKTDVPIDFRPDFPLLQVLPLPRNSYAEDTLSNYALVPDLTQLTAGDWDDYYDTVVRPQVQEVRPRGQYAAAARKRQANPVTTGRNEETGAQRRRLNARIDDPSPRQGRPFHVSIYIGISGPPTMASAPFNEPEWGDAQTIELIVSISARDCTVDPGGRELELPRAGDSNTVDFSVIATRPGEHQLSIKVYLAKQMILLQSLKFVVNVAGQDEVGIT